MSFNTLLQKYVGRSTFTPTQARENPYTHAPETQPAPQPTEPPAAVTQIADTVNRFMPALEQITGLTRREIFLHLLKTGIKGGSFESMISGLLGQKHETDVKFVRYVKTLAVWVPVAVFLFGLAVVSVVIFAKLILAVTGGI